ncbi:hypothetical protein L6164_004527 [Bauhinia variegata]|uniref:Uncharacterized protein n=1 Tax=Bauhinia variegata TaxID=167791 RepID=A0ACB9Q6X5_BAUVA|nr:hypothetical protein L6164_004527 [Bauhinia variegata]
MASSRTRTRPSNMPALRGPLLPLSSTSPPFASSTSSFSPHSSHLLTRSSSPTRANSYGRPVSPASSSLSSLRFPIDRSTSPGRSMSVTKQRSNAVTNQKRTCMCSPTTHPGSFRCAYHKRLGDHRHPRQQHQSQMTSCHSSSSSLNLRRSAMNNSLVRIGGVEGELVKRALTTLIRPSSHQQRRREGFQPRPSRLSIVSKSE